MKLTFDEDFPVGSATLNFSFTGILNDQMRGFYLSKYTDADGNEQRLATTQFEATDCRRAMPCWLDQQTNKQTAALRFVTLTITPAQRDAASAATLAALPPLPRRLCHARAAFLLVASDPPALCSSSLCRSRVKGMSPL